MPQTHGQNATEGSEDYGFMPGSLERWAEELAALRPWQDRPSVREVLEAWAGPRHTDGADAVAQQLQIIGRANNLGELSDLGVAAIAAHLLGNVLAGRDVLDYGPLPITGPSPRTTRRWYREYAQERVQQLVQYDLDVARLVGEGRTPAAARQVVRRRRRQ